MAKIPPSIKQLPLTTFFSSPNTKNPKESHNNSQGSATSKRPLDDSTGTKNTSITETALDEHDALPKRPCVDGSIDSGPTVSLELDRTSTNKQIAQLRRSLATRPSRSVLDLIEGLHQEWMSILAPQIESSKFQKLADFVKAERNRATVYPPFDKVFSWSQFCPPTKVRVVILGQDPYHGPKQAHGLAFSVQRPLRPPPSLVNMYKEVASDLGDSVQMNTPWPPTHGDLTGWARQGVLLLNAVLTVRASSANSHKDQGWESLTEAVIRYLNKEKSHLVFMLWGAPAQKQGSGINRNRHLVLQCPHPSPLSASRGFFGCRHFSKANDYLKQHDLPEIIWTQLD